MEAGLISSHLADIRNFAHGRHNWFSKHEADSGVIALSTNNDYKVIEKTLGLLPKAIPKTHISFNRLGGVEVIVGIVLSMHLTNWLGKERGIDPGRPGVPSFGSKIYGLTANPGFITSVAKRKAAIDRKRKLAPLNYGNRNEQLWIDVHNRFTRRLAAANIGGIVLDYDGTVIDSDKRWDPPDESMADELIRLIEENVVIGFATGREKSIRGDLRQAIPKKLWGKILIGYYDGAELKHLSDNTALSTRSDPLPQPKSLFTKLENNMLRVSKLHIVEAIKQNIPENSEILSIGDRGRWLGNDTEFLKETLSLSVDEVSYSAETCWNLCPAGMRGAQGNLYYLRRLKRKNGAMRFFP